MNLSEIVVKIITESFVQHTSTPVSPDWKSAFVNYGEKSIQVSFTTIYNQDFESIWYPETFQL